MALTLSSADVARLQAALYVLVSPLDHETTAAWRLAAFEHVRELLGADKGFHMLPADGEALVVGPDADSDGYVAWQTYYHKLDTGFLERRRALGLEVSDWSMVYDLAALKRTEIYNDFSARYGFLDPVAMTLDLSPGSPPASLTFYHEREDTPPFGARGLALLHLLLPAFKSGVRTCLRLTRHRAELTHLIDRSGERLQLRGLTGRVLHETPALSALLAENPEAERVRHAITSIAHALVVLVRPRKSTGAGHEAVARQARVVEAELRTRGAQLRISGTILGDVLLSPEPVVVVRVELRGTRPVTDEALQSRHRLTPREVTVARLLALGMSNAEVAQALHVRARTAEQHTARVLSKLGVRSRSAVGAMLRGELPPSAD